MKPGTALVALLTAALLAPLTARADGPSRGPEVGREATNAVPFPVVLEDSPAAVKAARLLGAHGDERTVVVDCSRGDSIAKALKSKADPLVVEVRGMCGSPC